MLYMMCTNHKTCGGFGWVLWLLKSFWVQIFFFLSGYWHGRSVGRRHDIGNVSDHKRRTWGNYIKKWSESQHTLLSHGINVIRSQRLRR